MTKRTCGSCQECCRVVSVRALNKPSHTTCDHQCKAGCAIYGERPLECKQYECAWLKGKLEEDMRPDISGVIVEDSRWSDVEVFFAFDAKPGAVEENRSRLHELIEPGHILFTTTEGGEMYCHPDDKDKTEVLAYLMGNGLLKHVDVNGEVSQL